MVQGYKFTFFYPQAKGTPQFKLENNVDGSLDTIVIRFKAGAPYQDLSFRIVNKEWDILEKHGFKSAFDERGVL